MARERRVLTSLDLLPEDCQDDVFWALSELNQRKRTQAEILAELNERLAAKGQGPISRSAFSRRNVRIKKRRDRLEERNAMYAGIAEELTPDKVGEVDIILGELLKEMIDAMMDEAGNAKELMQLASAYKQVVVAQNVSVDRRAKAEGAAKARLEKAVEAVAGEVEKTGASVDPAAVLALIRKAYNGE